MWHIRHNQKLANISQNKAFVCKCLGDIVKNRFQRRIHFLWPHLWQRWCCDDRGWLAGCPTEASSLARLCVPRKMAGYFTGNAYASEDLWYWHHWPSRKQVQRPGEGSWEECGREGRRAHEDNKIGKRRPKYCYSDSLGMNTYYRLQNNKMDHQSACKTAS